MILPKLAMGFQACYGLARGIYLALEIMMKTAKHSVANIDSEMLEKAPIHNLDAKRSVDFVDFELSRRGAKQLAVASAAQVKAKSADLIEQRQPGSFRSYGSLVRKGGKIPDIMLAWNNKQEELKRQGLPDEEIANLTMERRWNKDFDSLKAIGGPFTNAVEVTTMLHIVR